MNSMTFLAAAEELCSRQGARLTALRRRVLELVLAHDGVVKAYQILAELQQERGIAAPPTVYRALDFLVEVGLLHKVDALNGFIVCRHVGCHHRGLILVCSVCGKVSELDASPAFTALREEADERGFVITEQNLLLTGHCRSCTA